MKRVLRFGMNAVTRQEVLGKGEMGDEPEEIRDQYR
jgi:hypothetical protein